MVEKEKKEIVEVLQQIATVGKFYNRLFNHRFGVEIPEQVIKEYGEKVQKINGNKWYKSFLDLKNGTVRLAFCRGNYILWKSALQKCCERQKDEELVDPELWVAAINPIVNASHFYLCEYSRKKLVKQVTQVLRLYPDYDYQAEKDPFYDDRLYNGSLVYGGEDIISLRIEEVRAVENWKKMKAIGYRKK